VSRNARWASGSALPGTSVLGAPAGGEQHDRFDSVGVARCALRDSARSSAMSVELSVPLMINPLSSLCQTLETKSQMKVGIGLGLKIARSCCHY